MIDPDLLVAAYASGWFPMAVDDEIRWFSPDPRGILPLDTFRVPRRLARTRRQGGFTATFNRAFDEVIHACASVPRDPVDNGTWINDEILQSYRALHARGDAHSVEVWKDGALAGGLYGVSLRGAFFGESMFHRVTDASKIALVALVERLRERGYLLLDTQWVTPHLKQFGAVEVSRRTYLRRLRQALERPCRFTDGQPAAVPASRADAPSEG
jgi:leucyl/phenylalanyl-tRNA--protein transferase